MIAWVKVFVSYLVFVRENLSVFWDQTWLDACITPQVIYMEQALNLRFGRTDIRILDGTYLGPFIFSRQDDPDTEFYMDQDDSWVYSESDHTDVDFVVEIPEAIETDAPLIAALTHRYKLPGKNFIIQKR
jgi:hypothetical protein